MEAIDIISAMRDKLDDLERALKPVVQLEAFSKEGLRQTLNASFPERPAFASGKANPLPKDAAAPPFDDPSFQWRAGLVNAKLGGGLKAAAWRPGKPYPGFSSLPTNKEAQIYLNQDAIDLTGVDPISSDGENLIFTAAPITPEVRECAAAGPLIQYTSGAITSFPYSQCYGVFEMEAQFPAGRGFWPAFWLLPADLSWPPELDVVEALMHDVATAFTTVHFRKPDGGKTARGQANAVKNLSQGFHKFALRWTAEKLEWAIDGEKVFEVPTPDDLIDKPCYLLANLAVGGVGSWPGAPNEQTVFPAQMKIRSIRAWSL